MYMYICTVWNSNGEITRNKKEIPRQNNKETSRAAGLPIENLVVCHRDSAITRFSAINNNFFLTEVFSS